MKSQNDLKFVVLLVICLLMQMIASQPAKAGIGVARCDGCNVSQYEAIAQSNSLGYVYVYDYTNVILTLWMVRYDAETRRREADQLDVPPQTYNAFLTIMEAKTTAKGQVVIPIHEGQPAPPSLGGGYSPIGAFSGLGAHDVIQNATMRNRIGQNLSNTWVGVSGIQAIDDAGRTLISIAMSLITPFTTETVVLFEIHWADGTITVYEMKPDLNARYKNGSSVDNDENSIPDASFVNTDTSADYVGDYNFSNLDNVRDWVNTAAQYGIPVSGQIKRRLHCSWDGQTLTCRYATF